MGVALEEVAEVAAVVLREEAAMGVVVTAVGVVVVAARGTVEMAEASAEAEEVVLKVG